MESNSKDGTLSLIKIGEAKQFDSHGVCTDKNMTEMIERTAHFKEPLMKMALVVWDIIKQYNSEQSYSTKKLIVFISDGTLLGAFRNGKMIPYDYDFDFALYGTKNDLQALHDYLTAELKKHHEKYNKEYVSESITSYSSKITICDPEYGVYEDAPASFSQSGVEWWNVSIDIQLLSDHPHKLNKVQCIYFKDDLIEKMSHNKSDILPLSEIIFECHIFSAPNNVEQCLKNNYGCIEVGAVYDSSTATYVMP